MFRIWENLATCSIFELTLEGWIIVDVRDISDTERDINKARNKIELIAGLIVNGHKVVVRCIAGINRSNAFACAAMCLIMPQNNDLDATWNHHYDVVKGKVSRAQINSELIDTIKKALWSTNRFKYWNNASIWCEK